MLWASVRRERRAGSSPQSATRARRNVRPLVATQRAARARGRRGSACLAQTSVRASLPRHGSTRGISTRLDRLDGCDEPRGRRRLASAPWTAPPVTWRWPVCLARSSRSMGLTNAFARGRGLAHVAATALKRRTRLFARQASIVASSPRRASPRSRTLPVPLGRGGALRRSAFDRARGGAARGLAARVQPHTVRSATRRETAARSPPGGRLLLPEPLAGERFGVETERAALQKLRSDHDVAFTIIDVAATARAPEIARRQKSDAARSSRREDSSTVITRVRRRRRRESLRARRRTYSRRSHGNDSAFGESGDVIAEYLLLLRARAAADASRRKQARGSGNFRTPPRGSWPGSAQRAGRLAVPRCARFPADASCWRLNSARAG